MAVLVGELVDAPLFGVVNPAITQQVNQYAVDYWPWYVTDLGLASLLPVLVSSAIPVSVTTRVLVGEKVPRYFDDFYNRIHIIPNPVNLGNILANKTVALAMWNAFLTTKTLTDISLPGSLGVDITLPVGETLPLVFTPLREIVFQINAGLNGTPAIDSEIVFTLNGEDFPVVLTGRRVVIFPFPPNWSSPYDETFTYNSWVLRATDGSEQSGSNWGNQPRRQFEYTILVRGTQLQRLENLLFAWQDRVFGMPHWVEKSNLSSTALIGATVLPLDTTNRSFEDGGFGVVYADSDNFEAFSIVSKTDSSVTIGTALQRTWPVGTRVYPVSVALIGDTTGGTYQSDNSAVLPVSFECEPSQSPINNPTTDPLMATYKGEEVYLGHPDWSAGWSFAHEGPRHKIDFNTGLFRSINHQGFSNLTRKFNWQIRNRTESRALRAWIGRREGVARPVFMPTGISDMTLAADIASGSTAISVLSNDYGSLVAAAQAKRDIFILRRDGGWQVRRITGATVLTDGTTTLTLDSAITANFPVNKIKRFCFLNFYRQTSNSMTIRWLTDEIGVAETNLVTKVAP